MSAQNAHAHEDRLLDFAYGELPATEAQALEQHVQGCVRCSKALADIRGVRTTMAQLSTEPAPDAGLESLLAYAQQSARRASAGPEPKPSRWRRWLLPAVGLATVSTFGILSLEVNEGLHLEPNLAQKTASPARAPAEDETRTLGKREPKSAPASAPAPMGRSYTPRSDDLLAAAPASEALKDAPARNQADAQLKGNAAGRPSDWMNAGGGGAMLERRREGPAPTKKLSKAQDADGEFAALEPAQAPKEEAAGAVYGGKDARSTSDSAFDQAGGGTDKAQVAKRDSLRLGGASYGRGLASDDAAAMGEAAPPPPAPVASAPMAQAAPATPSATGAVSTSKQAPARAVAEPVKESARTEVAKPKSMEKQAPAGATTSRELARQAQAAANQGDRVREAQLLRAALAAGPSGGERLDLLSRLCDSESAQGQSDAAAVVCAQVVHEAPESGAAQMAQRRMRKAAPIMAPAASTKLPASEPVPTE
ncbi:anti-sigma factor [Corallococcus sp. Z5C101001]|uniref:anti-sigma factor family protein n=1 Tax=Corallococcus sp. Z5C101001 TaxID=2596829 RepID=UPI00117F6DEE|nr:zf-HC2 domain-containing protein [Corallococcus sp. Z5C101001]TSC31455.1 zf-HC2 domain-containing protein [Corallococcus sp. Z5C101001]